MGSFQITPEFITSLATLVAALTALVKVIQAHNTAKDTNAKMTQVAEQTNGTMDRLQARVSTLEASPVAPPAPPADPPAQLGKWPNGK